MRKGAVQRPDVHLAGASGRVGCKLHYADELFPYHGKPLNSNAAVHCYVTLELERNRNCIIGDLMLNIKTSWFVIVITN
jgi:hypothetical protein